MTKCNNCKAYVEGSLVASEFCYHMYQVENGKQYLNGKSSDLESLVKTAKLVEGLTGKNNFHIHTCFGDEVKIV